MDLILILLGLLLVVSVRPGWQPTRGATLDHQTTKTINGWFILLVLFSHFVTYLPADVAMMRWTAVWMATKGELIVTTFLAFSGYGIMVQLQKRGSGYVDHLPVQRVLFVWLKFAVAVTLFLIVTGWLGRSYAPSRIIAAYFGLATVGNSGWYVFTILLMYLLTYVAVKISGERIRLAIGLVTLATLVYSVLATRYLPSYYAVVSLSYPAGLWYGYRHSAIEGWLACRWSRYWVSLVGTGLIFVISYYGCSLTTGWLHLVTYQLAALAFVSGWVLLAMKLRFVNPLLAYLGGPALFSIYILRRLPMMIGQRWGLAAHPLGYLGFVVGATLLLAAIFDWVVDERLRRWLKKAG